MRGADERSGCRGQADFAAVRTGRANAALLDRVIVDYYGTPHTPQPARSRFRFPNREC